MNTQVDSKAAIDQAKAATTTQKVQQSEDKQKSCKDGVCELNWKPTRPQAA